MVKTSCGLILELGLVDLSLVSAWALDRSIALDDKLFLSCLIWLRGRIRLEVVQRAKVAARDASCRGSWTNVALLKNLEIVA
ncbi:hypothetical protein B0T10DRAFT_135264 [Thelonectria olida]|uniref:Uncharacterized protein n=1 Tax=Thelonectria olida TaxID=1576542 RepID=A0A9P9AP67_9HYPO|nr:hypothetical protein B0T10DRAFT_135264 [Thelonectria olida]